MAWNQQPNRICTVCRTNRTHRPRISKQLCKRAICRSAPIRDVQQRIPNLFLEYRCAWREGDRKAFQCSAKVGIQLSYQPLCCCIFPWSGFQRLAWSLIPDGKTNHSPIRIQLTAGHSDRSHYFKFTVHTRTLYDMDKTNEVVSDDSDITRLHTETGKAWDEASGQYTREIDAAVAKLEAGIANLMEPEIEHLTRLLSSGGDVLHVQCAGGTDTLSILLVGASTVTGTDISPNMLAVRGVQRLVGLAPESEAEGEITVESIERHLDSAELPPLDLLIRTSGELRLSNFLLWQSAYAEMIFTDVLWPDFTPEHLTDALAEFTRRERRYGGR